MRSLLTLVIATLVSSAALSAQTVTLTGHKKVYTRAKPISGYKKTFSIRRPIAKAATPALSRKITAAIDPVSGLEINSQEELTVSQWLSEADFTEVMNEQGILTVELWMEGSGAYSDGLIRYVVVDVATGERLTPSTAFIDLPGLIAAAKKKQDAQVEQAIKDIKAHPEVSEDDDPSRLFEYTDFEEKDLQNFLVDRAGVAFMYDYGFPNVFKALEPEGELRFTWDEIRPFLKPGGLLARFVR